MLKTQHTIAASLGERPGKLGAAPDLPPDIPSSKDRSRGRSRPHRRDSSNGDRPQSRDCSLSVRKSYDNSHSSYGTGTNHRYRYRDRDRSRHVKRGRDSESSLSRVSESGSSDGGHWKSKSKRHKPTDEDDLRCYGWAARVWFDELPLESIDSYKDLKAAFLAYFMQQRKYVKDPVEIHNIKQKYGETIEDFMELFKVETGRMKGAPECMQISGFMHGVNNYELTKRLNEHVPKTMEEIMITTTAFIRGEAAIVGKKKGHTSYRTHDQSKRHTSEKRSDFPGQPREGRGSSSFTPLQGHQKKFSRSRQESSSRHHLCSGTEGPLVIEAEIGGHMIHRMYVDGGSSTEVLYEHCFNRLWPKVKNQMVPTTTSLTSFSGETIWPLGQLRLLITIGDADHSTRAWMNFMIIRSLSPYNGIIERPGIKEIQAVPSTAHGMLKFPADGGIVPIRSTILIPAECATVITSSKEIPKEAGVRHENFKVDLHPNFPDQEVAIRGTLSAKGRTELCSLLKENLDIFAWHPSNMTGVSRSVAEHWLNIQEGAWPRNARRPSKQRIVTHFQKSIGKLNLSAATLSIVSWTLTKAITKYSWQTASGQSLLQQIGRNIEVYVDDLVIKRHTEAEMLRDIGETFRTLRKINLKLNLKKCTFGAVEGMFLGYMITPEGIKSCPDKAKAVL
nr:reverse transcriptase domain-containing protein [Tanacetum cinerariifolium]